MVRLLIEKKYFFDNYKTNYPDYFKIKHYFIQGSKISKFYLFQKILTKVNISQFNTKKDAAFIERKLIKIKMLIDDKIISPLQKKLQQKMNSEKTQSKTFHDLCMQELILTYNHPDRIRYCKNPNLTQEKVNQE